MISSHRIGAALAAGLMIASCGADGVAEPEPLSAPPIQVVVTNEPLEFDLPALDGTAAQSQQWHDEGDRLRTELADMVATAPEGYVDENRGIFAYNSRPIDIPEPGIYEIVFDVDEEFFLSGDEGPDGVAFNAPWDTPFEYGFAGQKVDKSTMTLVVELNIPSQDFDPYVQFTLWAY